MFMSSSSGGSSNESNSDDEKSHLPIADATFSDNEKQDEQVVVIIRHSTNRLRRQQATTSLQSPLSARNNSSPSSIDDDQDVIISDQTSIDANSSTNQQVLNDLNRVSFNESERTDSGIGRDSGSSWRLSNYSDSLHQPQQQPSQQQKQTGPLDLQQGIYLFFNVKLTYFFERETINHF